MQEDKARKTKNILEEIKLAIAGKAKAGGYAYVFDADAAANATVMLYSSGESDITDSVLAQLNAGADDAVSSDGAGGGNLCAGIDNGRRMDAHGGATTLLLPIADWTPLRFAVRDGPASGR